MGWTDAIQQYDTMRITYDLELEEWASILHISQETVAWWHLDSARITKKRGSRLQVGQQLIMYSFEWEWPGLQTRECSSNMMAMIVTDKDGNTKW